MDGVDQNAHSVLSDLDLHCPPKLLIWSPVGKEFRQDDKSQLTLNFK